MSEEWKANSEIFGGPGVGKSTLIRSSGFRSSKEVCQEEVERRLRTDWTRRYWIPLPGPLIRMQRKSFLRRHEKLANLEFEIQHKDFSELSRRVIHDSPVSEARKARCLQCLINAVLSWWFVGKRAEVIWDESFAKAVLYICGMEPAFSEVFLPELVRTMPKRDRYILLDGLPEQAVMGQVRRGKYANSLSATELADRIRSASKYRAVAEKLAKELGNHGYLVETRLSQIEGISTLTRQTQ